MILTFRPPPTPALTVVMRNNELYWSGLTSRNQAETGTRANTVVLAIPQWGVIDDNHREANVTHIRAQCFMNNSL